MYELNASEVGEIFGADAGSAFVEGGAAYVGTAVGTAFLEGAELGSLAGPGGALVGALAAAGAAYIWEHTK